MITFEDDWERTVSTSLDGAACKDCLFWQHLVGVLGECRFNAPVPAASLPGLDDPGENPMLGKFPQTYHHAWCGDFMRKKQATGKGDDESKT